MNASSSRVNRLDSTGRTAPRATTIGPLAAAAIALVATGLTAPAGATPASAAGPAAAQGQEYVVGDLPETYAGPDHALVGLPANVDGGAATPAGFDLPQEVFDDETGANEYTITDDAPSLFTGGDPARCPRWTAQIDALFLFLGNVPSRTLYIDDTTLQPALSLGDAPPAMSAAPRYALTWHRDACRAFEINYFSVGSFRGIGEAIAPDTSTFSSVDLGGVPFNDVFGAAVEQTSGIKSWEFNLRRSNGGAITWIAGFRWVEWTQQLAIGDVGIGGLDFYSTETGNNLYGGQLGADMMLWNRGERIRINGIAKGGAYYNYQAYQRSAIFSDSAVFDAAVAASKDTISFVGEVGLVGEYRLTNWLSWRAGYTVFWLGGVANAANQLAVTDFTVDPPTTRVSPYSSVLLHGATTGLEARW